MNEVHQKMDLEREFPDSLKFAQLTMAAVNESRRWIELMTGDRFKHHNNLIKSLSDGVLLCRLTNALRPGSIKQVNHLQNPVAYLDNLSLFQSSCRDDFGLQEAQLFDIRDLDDLDIRGTIDSEEDIQRETDRRLKNILMTLYWLGRVTQPLRPDTTLDLRTFESLVDSSYFDITSSDDPNSPQCLIGARLNAPNIGDDNVGGEKLEWVLKFENWKDKRMRQNESERGPNMAGNGCTQESNKMTTPRTAPNEQQHEISCFIEGEDYDEAPPLPPNWKTFPGVMSSFDPEEVEFFRAEETKFFDTSSSSSSASSFATKEFVGGPSTHPPVTHHLSSPTTAILSASPETLSHDTISSNFDRLLREVEKLSVISKSQSLKHLEDFDEVGFEEEEGGGDDDVEKKEDKFEEEEIEEDLMVSESSASSTSKQKLVRRKSDFMDELAILEEVTHKFDDSTSPTFDPFAPSSSHPSSFAPSFLLPPINRVVTLQSPELLADYKPSSSASLVEIIQQNSVKRWSTLTTKDIQSNMMERFAHDLENVLKVEQSSAKGKMFDLVGERRRMEEWNQRAEQKLKDKFEKDQYLLKEKLKEDLRRAHQMERMNQLQEEKFLEEEVIEVKNRKSFAKECSGIKFSMSSLSLFAPLPYMSRGIQSASPNLPPNYTSLTDDWLNQSFSSELEKSSLNDTPKTDTSIFPSITNHVFSPNSLDEIEFEEPGWMKLTTEKVDKISILDVPANTATIEVLPDSLTTSSESIHSLRQSKEDIADVINGGSSIILIRPDNLTPSREAPPIPERNDSLLVASDILVSREQAAYLSFDASIAKFTKPSSSPTSLLLTSCHHVDDKSATVETLLTPSSDRCSEVCVYNPPSPITPHKRAIGSLSSVFPSPQSSSAERPDFLLMEGSSVDDAPTLRSVDYLFAYHDDQLKRRYYWATSPFPSNHVSPLELPSDPKIGSPINRSEEKPSCSECGYCLALDQTITLFALKSRYHPECFKCKGCDVLLNADNVAIYQSIPHCFACYNQLCRH